MGDCGKAREREREHSVLNPCDQSGCVMPTFVSLFGSLECCCTLKNSCSGPMGEVIAHGARKKKI